MYNLFKCRSCGCLFHENDFKYVEEPRGEYLGRPCTEKMSYSPCCTGDYEEYEEESDLWVCKDCGKIFTEEDVDKDKYKVGEYEWEIKRACPDCLGEVEEYKED